MSNIRKISAAVFAGFMVIALGVYVAASGREAGYIPDIEAGYEGMTMWQVIVSGGAVMVVLALLSVAALSLIIFYAMTMKKDKLLPEDFLESVFSLAESGRINEAVTISAGGTSVLSKVFYAGASKRDKGPVMVREAMEEEGRREIDILWRRLSYLGDIAAIAPMVGLLGTVLGMIQAFNVIAFQAGAVKPVLLASGISKAMVTTAAGLIIAIPAMIFYSYFRGTVQASAARLENISGELYQLITGKPGQGG